ncbi:aminopeptidase N [Colwellia polaris]|jgi:aminopeptidase N|uniref:aminopeptidase N n=1 Tax=Colwellia polaris TaxID=326537 RepID=UPI000A16E57B|nr:aminopeptidase N [Colwellia polaris]|tara:strand:- start:1667 stop:4219 length:2553 start_codon:yes stop_codon:yes gene_type:complete
MSDFAPRYLADYSESNFSISTVELDFKLDETKTRVTNRMKMTRKVATKDPLVLDGEHLTLLSVLIDDEILSSDDYQLSDNSLSLLVDKAEFTLEIITEINPLDNTALEGLFKSGDAYCTQCEAEGFRRISYYLDRPDIMATFSTKVIADKEKFPFLLSNGNKVAEGDLPSGQHFVQWHDPFPKPCYLFALVAGDFDILKDNFTTSSGRDVALEIFVDKGNFNKAHHAMASLKHSMKWDEETFGLEYDLDIYMIVAVDFFNMGAMENKGLNVFNSKFVLADETSATDVDYFNVEAVIAHEYFHNWTGNRVTCRDWFQLSLKEGLTVFRDQQFSADMHSAAVNRIQNVRVLRSLQFAEDAGPMAHPIRPEKVIEMNNFYTLTVYEKGAEVIRMIHTLLGADKFRAGIDLYFKRFDGMAVTCDDFISAMSDASGVDLTQFKHWYTQSGTPIINVNESFDIKTSEYTLTLAQSNGDNPALHIPIGIELITAKDEQNQSTLLQLTEKEQSWTFKGFSQKPVLALLTGFSAPVKAPFSQPDQDLQIIMTRATDEFCRWDAGQKLLTTYIMQLLHNPALVLPESLYSAFVEILNADISEAFKAEQLTLPSFSELADSIDEVDPIALLNAIENIQHQIASKLAPMLLKQYQQNIQADYANDGKAIGKRALKNICLSYLTRLNDHQNLVTQQYQSSNNMTDTLATLSCAAKSSHEKLNEMMVDFEGKWQDITLVMDKWFAIQASVNDESIFDNLSKLIAHPLFSLKNPNRARSLIGAFVNSNPRYFHCASGRGYQFLIDQLIKLNDINPQVASRLITPLIQFKSFDQDRQIMIKAKLEQLAKQEVLSKDLKEKLDAALA